MHDLSVIANAIEAETPKRDSERPWALSYRRAHAIKRHMSMEQSARFKTLSDLARTFGASHNFEPADEIDGIRALRSDRGGNVCIHLRDHGSSPHAEDGSRFSLER